MTKCDPDRLRLAIAEVEQLSKGDPRAKAAACAFKYGSYVLQRDGVRGTSTQGPDGTIASWLRAARLRLAKEEGR